MKADKLVEAFTTQREVEDFAYAVLATVGPRGAWLILRNAFDVNGSQEERVTLRTAMAEWPLTPLDDDEALQLHCGLCGAPSGNTDTCVPCAVRSSKQERP